MPARLTPLTAAQRDRVSRHWDWAARMTGRFLKSFPRHRELILSAAALGLVQAALAYDPALNRDDNFEAFAYLYVRGRVLDDLRREARRDRERLAALTDGAYLDPPPACEEHEAFEARLRGATPRQKAALRLVYRDGLTQEEAGAALGVCKSTACNSVHQGLKALRAAGGA